MRAPITAMPKVFRLKPIEKILLPFMHRFFGYQAR
jgi:hypothetical protein